MIRNSFILKFLALAALGAFFASPAAAERLTKRTSQGNNIGITCKTGWGMPWTSEAMQFPRGTSNLIQNDGCTIANGVAQDLDGDGSAEDTSGINHVRSMMAGLASLESIDLITSLANAGMQMEGEMGKSEYNRIWTSLDDEELADWPIEGRIPRGDPNGVPNVAAGGETIFFHSSTVFNSWGYTKMSDGCAYEWTLRFLNFAESNNMMYVNQFLRNMSEYCKWNPNSTYSATGQAHPAGVKWHGLVTVANFRNWAFGGTSAGWALNAEKRLVGWYVPTSETAAFSPPKSPLVGFKMINPPHTADQTADMTSLHNVDWGAEFGFAGHKQMFVGFPWGTSYAVALDKETGYYPGVINPFTGEQIRGAWPGMLQEDDVRYSQWLWGGTNQFMSYPCYGELTDIEPRDTVVFDAAYIFTYPGVDSYVRPELDIANIDDPMMQEMLSPLEDYAVIADIVINSGYMLPETPVAPALTIIPGDREVTITWSDVNLQTPDTYYYFLEEEGLNPAGYYKEYDFEGFRFYRSYVGPSDSHSELMDDYNLSSGNVQFYYIDKMQDDTGRWRMRNGMKVWYALVPYDRNYDTATGEMFSLPDPASGKTWNRPGAELYTLVSRSDASNYVSAGLLGTSYIGPATDPAGTADLAGDGTGKLVDMPKDLQHPLEFTFEAINNERITQDQTVYLECTNVIPSWGCVQARPLRVMSLLDSGGSVIQTAPAFSTRGSAEQVFMDTPTDEGVSFALHMIYTPIGPTAKVPTYYIHTETDLGGWTGGLSIPTKMCQGLARTIGTKPSVGSWIRTGVFELTWKATAGGMSVDVAELVRGTSVPFSQYPDNYGCWGFMPAGTYDEYWSELKADVLQANRENVLLEEIPADNTDEFGIWLDGIVFVIDDVPAMPSAGTKFTFKAVAGNWNSDNTVFTQLADPPWFNDKWKIDVKAMSMEPEDADLSKVKVVPNPYMASSFLDLSTNNRRIDFVNLPDKCTIRIYTLSGNLVNVLNHVGANRQGWGNYTNWDRINAQSGEPAVYTGYDNHSGTEPWNLRNRFGQTVASGLYFFHVTDQRGETHTGKFYIVN